MTTAHLARHQSPARDPIGWLLLAGMPWTNERPWFGFVGATMTVLVGALAISRWLS